jgi:hypothetical protein
METAWKTKKNVKNHKKSDSTFVPVTELLYCFWDMTNKYLEVVSTNFGVRGSIVVKALCYKLEGRGFETR